MTLFQPIWTRTSRYIGKDPPDASIIGNYVSSVPNLPSDISAKFSFIKSADNSEQVEGRNEWVRTEAWEGFTYVDFDINQIFERDA